MRCVNLQGTLVPYLSKKKICEAFLYQEKSLILF